MGRDHAAAPLLLALITLGVFGETGQHRLAAVGGWCDAEPPGLKPSAGPTGAAYA
jgi:hypothetical protein